MPRKPKEKPPVLEHRGLENNVIYLGINHMSEHSAKRLVVEAELSSGTPEDIMVVKPGKAGRLNSDALLCAQERATATLYLLMQDADSPTGFGCSHQVVIAALWAVEGYLQQIRMIAESADSGKRVA